MAEEEPRVQKVLAYLESIKEHGLVKPKTIGGTAEVIGKDLYDLKERGLAESPEAGLWKITPDGTARIIEAKPKAQPKPKLKLKPNSELKPAVEEAVPTQVDILKVTASSIEA